MSIYCPILLLLFFWTPHLLRFLFFLFSVYFRVSLNINPFLGVPDSVQTFPVVGQPVNQYFIESTNSVCFIFCFLPDAELIDIYIHKFRFHVSYFLSYFSSMAGTETLDMEVVGTRSTLGSVIEHLGLQTKLIHSGFIERRRRTPSLSSAPSPSTSSLSTSSSSPKEWKRRYFKLYSNLNLFWYKHQNVRTIP